jgi:hypothetical protein
MLKTVAPNIGTLPPGTVLQVVHATNSTRATITTGTFANTNLSATITPTRASSKIMIVASTCVYPKTPAGAAFATLARNSTELSGLAAGMATVNALDVFTGVALNWLDSPNTTSSVTYRLQGKSYVAGQESLFGDNGKDSMILIEVAA